MVIGHEAAGTGKDTDHAMMCRAVQLTAGRVCQTSAMFRSSTVGCSGEWAGWHTCRTSPSTYALQPPLHLPAAVEAVGQGVTELQPGDRAAIEPGVPAVRTTSSGKERGSSCVPLACTRCRH